jgi:hypothetical protein
MPKLFVTTKISRTPISGMFGYISREDECKKGGETPDNVYSHLFLVVSVGIITY